MELSKRLEMVAGLVTQERIADIGTDHGYVPIYLYKQAESKRHTPAMYARGLWKNAEKILRFTVRRMSLKRALAAA